MSKKKKNICLVTTVYSFFLYVLINGYDENDIFIFGPNFPKEVSKNIKHITLPGVYFKYGMQMEKLNSIQGVFANIKGYSLYFYTYIKLRILLFFKTFNQDVEVYGHAQTAFSYMFYENDSNIIEDGLENYTVEICETHKINPIVDKFLHLCGIYFLNNCETYGSHKNIKNVYLTKPFNHPLIKNKVRLIDIAKQWEALSPEKQAKILTILNVPKNINFDDKTAVILTQPLFETELASFDEEINMYKEIMNKFNDYNIIIKPHPHDKKDYEKIFPNVKIIEKSFPIELLDLIGMTPSVVCSVVSAALFNFKDSNLYVYEGKLKNEKLIKAREELLKIIKEENLELISI